MSTPAHSFEAGCRCPDCDEGLLAYAPDRGRYLAALSKLKPVLRVVTMPQDIEDACAGTFTCDCARCMRQRAALLRRGSRDVRQPWEPRTAA